MLLPDDLIMKHNCSKSMIAAHMKHKSSTYTALLPDYFKNLLKTKRLSFSGLK